MTFLQAPRGFRGRLDGTPGRGRGCRGRNRGSVLGDFSSVKAYIPEPKQSGAAITSNKVPYCFGSGTAPADSTASESFPFFEHRYRNTSDNPVAHIADRNAVKTLQFGTDSAGEKPKQSTILLPDAHKAVAPPYPIRLQEYAVGLFPAAPTKSAIKKAIKKGWVTVNGQVANTATWIRGGELICLSIPEAVPAGKKLVFPLEVIWEDEYLAAIYKPAGILVSGNSFKTITNALAQNLKQSRLADAAKPQPVHRLDYPTTGILLVGKTSSSIRALNRLFAEKQITKTYFAVTIGEMDNQGTICTEVDGKPAQSHYRVEAVVASSRFQQLNLLRLTPQTGRRHQLRKHLAGIGHPILGDKDYGKDGLILQGNGLYLHAHSLRFEHPFTGEQLHLSAALPLRFRKIFPTHN